ncbi:unnamed protein product [Clonostachys rosea]|uniref:F-box domain-containing protein n=1 Tax=Bionectria ochroleuca TaxID=29856 RepID=A0ABY6UST0_BIOOC|nr:unnamed protein product [Clonostachys rosea]
MEQPNSQCRILQMTPDVILLIADNLPDHANVLLSQTCRDLRYILNKHTFPALAVRERMRFLVHLNRQDPNVWVCSTCKKTHRITDAELREDLRASSCPNYKVSQLPRSLFSVNYVQVQLALKYTRMGMSSSEISTHLERLMRRQNGFHMIRNNKFIWSSRPRIVDGRFFVKYRWTYILHNISSASSEMPKLILCHHQRLNRPAEGIVWGEEKKQLLRAMQGAFLNDETGVEYCRSCPFCQTDFAVRVYPAGMVVDAWKDFGPEDAPGNSTWVSHFSTKAQRSPSDFGKVRRLFEEV